MTRERLDALDERVRGVREAVEGLDETHVRVRRRLQAVEAAVDAVPAPENSSTPTARRTDTAAPEPEHAEATDADVAAAVHAVEADRRMDE